MNRNKKTEELREAGSNRKPSAKSKSKRYRGKGKSSNSRGPQSSAMKEMDDPKFRQVNKYNDGNDPDYYFTNLELAEQAATFPFPYFLGHAPTVGGSNVPTMAVFAMNPSIGNTVDVTATSPTNSAYSAGVNMAAQKLYTRLSVASGRTANYQPADVIMSILAVNEVVSIIEAARRFFGIATTYSMRNRIYAIRLLDMLVGIESSATIFSFGHDFVEHMADYRMALNIIIAKINQIPILADLGYTRKCIEMYQKVYLDSISDLAQTYAFVPYSTWILDETTQGGSTLVTRRDVFNPSGVTVQYTFQSWLDLLNEMTDALLNSTTLNMVYADMFNYQAKFSMNFMKLDFVLEGYSVVPEYNERVLQQIKNMVITHSPARPATGAVVPTYCTIDNDVSQNVNYGFLRYNPMFSTPLDTTSSGTGPLCQLFFDFETSTPTLVDKIDNLKLAVGLANTWETYNSIKYETYATLPDHYCTLAKVYGPRCEDVVRVLGNRKSKATQATSGVLYDLAVPSSQYTWVDVADVPTDVLTKFNHFPLAVAYDTQSSSATSGMVTRTSGDLNYFTTMSFEHFRKINDLEFQGLFDLR